jgi:hypothetical protein
MLLQSSLAKEIFIPSLLRYAHLYAWISETARFAQTATMINAPKRLAYVSRYWTPTKIEILIIMAENSIGAVPP